MSTIVCEIVLREIRWRLKRSKTFLIPSHDFKTYVDSTKILFEEIIKESGCQYIIDSSKNPCRILVLKKIGRVKVLHLTRRFLGVLNSSKRVIEKDISKGYEIDLLPRRFHAVLIDWILNNLFIELFTRSKIKVVFEDYVSDISILNSITNTDYSVMTEFQSPHMMAGNALRMKKGLKINKRLSDNFEKVPKQELSRGRVIERVFWFWC